MDDVIFIHNDYSNFLEYNLTNNIIYCDPPYSRRSRYYDEFNKKMSFDSDLFWDFCVTLSHKNIIVVSENYYFLKSKYDSYDGTKKIVELPNRKNRFGSSCVNSGEYVCIITKSHIIKYK